MVLVRVIHDAEKIVSNIRIFKINPKKLPKKKKIMLNLSSFKNIPAGYV
jgi:hypothetical protein